MCERDAVDDPPLSTLTPPLLGFRVSLKEASLCARGSLRRAGWPGPSREPLGARGAGRVPGVEARAEHRALRFPVGPASGSPLAHWAAGESGSGVRRGDSRRPPGAAWRLKEAPGRSGGRLRSSRWPLSTALPGRVRQWQRGLRFVVGPASGSPSPNGRQETRGLPGASGSRREAPGGAGMLKQKLAKREAAPGALRCPVGPASGSLAKLTAAL